MIEFDGPPVAFLQGKDNQTFLYVCYAYRADDTLTLIKLFKQWQEAMELQYPNHIRVWRKRPSFTQDEKFGWEMFFRCVHIPKDMLEE